MKLTTRPKYLYSLSVVAFLLCLTFCVQATKADPLPLDPGGLELKIPVGFERWHPHAAPDPESIITAGAGWFYQNNLTLDDINVVYPGMGFRAVDIEVETWGDDPRFSAVFVQNTGIYATDHWFVAMGTEQELRDLLFGGQYQNYRMLDLEVPQYAPTLPPCKRCKPEVNPLPDVVAALLVTNSGHQATPAWDFIVHATPIELLIWTEAFPDQMRVIDYEMSLDDQISNSSNPKLLDKVLYSQIFVFDEGVEHVETTIFQYSTPLELWALQEEGWQLIDGERNIPLMAIQFPQFYGTFTGVFVQKDNITEFYENENGYSNFPFYTTDDKRMIDLELVREPNDTISGLDELFLLYD